MLAKKTVNMLILAVTTAMWTHNSLSLSCGTPSVKPIEYARIVGGREARAHSWPWQVALCGGGSATSCFLFCGGSIVSDRHVLTAAHCVKTYKGNTKALTIRAGMHRQGESGLSVRVVRISRHPNYDPLDGTTANDIAILELAKKLQFNRHVSAVCLPGSYVGSTSRGNKAIVTGWGWLSEEGGVSQNLQQVSVPFVSNRQCQTDYGFPIDNTRLCLGNQRKGGKDSCLGDSGGPAVKKTNGRWYQYGIVSVGRGCGEAGFPGIYTRVSQFCDFISWATGQRLCRGEGQPAPPLMLPSGFPFSLYGFPRGLPSEPPVRPPHVPSPL